MNKSIRRLQRKNPEFNHYLYDDSDCRDFIRENFDSEVVNAYDNIIPGAYRADLWRYCILYIKGGIYIDVKYSSVATKLVNFTDTEYFVKDRPNYWKSGENGVHNAFMICHSKNPILMKCISKIVENVNTLNYDYNALYPTGPGLLGSFFEKDYKFEMFFSECARYIIYKNDQTEDRILKMYENYRLEQQKTQLSPHYSVLWKRKMIYKQN